MVEPCGEEELASATLASAGRAARGCAGGGWGPEVPMQVYTASSPSRMLSYACVAAS